MGFTGNQDDTNRRLQQEIDDQWRRQIDDAREEQARKARKSDDERMARLRTSPPSGLFGPSTLSPSTGFFFQPAPVSPPSSFNTPVAAPPVQVPPVVQKSLAEPVIPRIADSANRPKSTDPRPVEAFPAATWPHVSSEERLAFDRLLRADAKARFGPAESDLLKKKNSAIGLVGVLPAAFIFACAFFGSKENSPPKPYSPAQPHTSPQSAASIIPSIPSIPGYGIAFRKHGDFLAVTGVVIGSPAWREHIRADDRITAIGGVPTHKLTESEAEGLLKRPGHSGELTLRHKYMLDDRRVTLTRTMLPADVTYTAYQGRDAGDPTIAARQFGAAISGQFLSVSAPAALIYDQQSPPNYVAALKQGSCVRAASAMHTNSTIEIMATDAGTAKVLRGFVHSSSVTRARGQSPGACRARPVP